VLIRSFSANPTGNVYFTKQEQQQQQREREELPGARDIIDLAFDSHEKRLIRI
jgi:hypothetical protein